MLSYPHDFLKTRKMEARPAHSDRRAGAVGQLARQGCGEVRVHRPEQLVNGARSGCD